MLLAASQLNPRSLTNTFDLQPTMEDDPGYPGVGRGKMPRTSRYHCMLLWFRAPPTACHFCWQEAPLLDMTSRMALTFDPGGPDPSLYFLTPDPIDWSSQGALQGILGRLPSNPSNGSGVEWSINGNSDIVLGYRCFPRFNKFVEKMGKLFSKHLPLEAKLLDRMGKSNHAGSDALPVIPNQSGVTSMEEISPSHN